MTLVKVKRELLAACVTCPLCHKLLRHATTISECLHTFCRKCIFEKLTDEDVDCCPICNIDLGCVPLEKLRDDHSLQDVRAKIFPFKRRKVNAPEVSPTPLPARRKERSLSSLVVNTPPVRIHTGLTGRRTKAVARKAAALCGVSPTIDESIKKEGNNIEGHAENSCSPETLSKKAHSRKQSFSNAESHLTPPKDTENEAQPHLDMAELWKPLTCLVEAANRTKFPKSILPSPVKAEQINDPGNEIHISKTKVKEHLHKSKAQYEENCGAPAFPVLIKARILDGISRKRRKRVTTAQALLDAAVGKCRRRTSPIWFSLLAHADQEGDAPLSQISANYLMIKDGNLPVSFIHKYLVKKLNLTNENEVEIMCQGQSLGPAMALHRLVDFCLESKSSHRSQALLGSSAKQFVMVLYYRRRVPAS